MPVVALCPSHVHTSWQHCILNKLHREPTAQALAQAISSAINKKRQVGPQLLFNCQRTASVHVAKGVVNCQGLKCRRTVAEGVGRGVWGGSGGRLGVPKGILAVTCSKLAKFSVHFRSKSKFDIRCILLRACQNHPQN